MPTRKKQTPAAVSPEIRVVETEVSSEAPAENIKVLQTRTNQVNATSVQLQDSMAGQVTAQRVTATESIIGLLQTGSVEAQNSILTITSAQNNNIQGVVGLSVGQQTFLSDTRAGVIVANELTSDHIQSVVVIAKNINGPVEVFADRRSIALFGILTGLVLGIVFSVFRLIRGR